MVKNRYVDDLEKHNQMIIDLSPANVVLRLELAMEIAKLGVNSALEIGVGEGDQTQYVLKEDSQVRIDALDVSQKMLAKAKKNIDSSQVTWIAADALEHFNKGKNYDLIYSAWTIHNFDWDAKRAVFAESFQALNEGGSFLLFDKVYPDDESLCKELFDLQIARYRYLPDAVREQITTHEVQDRQKDYFMQESQLIGELKAAGFKEIRVLDRVERDVILVAKR